MVKITPVLYQISFGPVNAFLVEDKGLTLIDTGYKHYFDKLFKAIKKGGKNPYDIKQIILTHCHPDHAGAAAQIKKLLNIPVYAHEKDAPLIQHGIAGRYPWQRTSGWLNQAIYHLYIKNAPKTNDPAPVEETLTDGDVLPVAGGMRILHSPGHSAGHIALLLEKEGTLIAGDICANNAGLGLSTVYENRLTGIKSIAKVSRYSFDKMVFGHGKPVMEHAAQKLRNHFAIPSNEMMEEPL